MPFENTSLKSFGNWKSVTFCNDISEENIKFYLPCWQDNCYNQEKISYIFFIYQFYMIHVKDMFGWRGWNEICWVHTYGTSLAVFISYVEIKPPSLLLKLLTFHKKSFWREEKKIKCQVYISLEHTTAADLLWASNYSSISSETLEKHCSLDWQTDHRTCNQNTSVTTALEESLLCLAALAVSCTAQKGSLNCHDFASWLVLNLNNTLILRL